MLKTKKPLNQFFLVLAITMVSLWLGSVFGPIILSPLTGVSLDELFHPEHWDYSQEKYAVLMRGLQLIQFLSLFLLPSLLCAYLFSGNKKEYLGFRKPWNPVYFAAAVLLMFVSYPLVEWLGVANRNIPLPASWLKWIGDKEESAEGMIKGMLTRHTIKDLLLNVAFIAGLAAIGEELFFRSLLQRIFIKIFRAHWAGIIVTAILFSAIHMQFFGFLPRFALGMLLGMIYWYSGSIRTAMLAHFVYDAFWIVVVYFAPPQTASENTLVIPNLNLLAAGSLILTAAVSWWMIRRSQTSYTQVYGNDSTPVTEEYPFQ